MAVDVDEAVVGWIAASQVSTRAVYQGVVEHSIYVGAQVRGRGVGHVLLAAFTDASDAVGVWTIQSGVFPENQASLALHAAHGFRTVGVRERIGRMSVGPSAGRWRDNILIERRSARAGV